MTTPEHRYIKDYCHYDGAYLKGYNDAQSGLKMDQDVSKPCLGHNTKAVVEKAYRAGYHSYFKKNTSK